MEWIGRGYTAHPFLGSRRLTTRPVQEAEAAGVAVGMGGKGRCPDDVFVGRLWRAVKYEDIYLWRYEGAPQRRRGRGRSFPYYNEARPDQALDYQTPAAVYRPGRAVER